MGQIQCSQLSTFETSKNSCIPKKRVGPFENDGKEIKSMFFLINFAIKNWLSFRDTHLRQQKLWCWHPISKSSLGWIHYIWSPNKSKIWMSCRYSHEPMHSFFGISFSFPTQLRSYTCLWSYTLSATQNSVRRVAWLWSRTFDPPSRAPRPTSRYCLGAGAAGGAAGARARGPMPSVNGFKHIYII